MNIRTILYLLLPFTSLAQDATKHSLVGAWEIVQIEKELTNSVNSDPEPNLMLFTENHYSFVWSSDEDTMRRYKEPWVASDAEKMQRFDEIFVNTGSYKWEGEKLTVYPVVAKNPEFIGGYMIFKIEWDEHELVLTPLDEYSVDGVQTPWVRVSSGLTHLTLNRLSK